MKKNKEKFAVFAVMSIYFLTTGLTVVQPALQNIMQAFPETPVSMIYMIMTLPTLVTIPMSVMVGSIVGKKIKFRTIAVIGLIFFTIPGVMPYFLDSVNAILISRLFFGIGVGIITPLGAALALLLFDESQRPKILGNGNVSTNLGNIFFLMGGALLCSIGWRMSFLAYLIGLVVLIIVLLWLPEPEIQADLNLSENQKNVKLPTEVYGISLLLGIGVVLLYPVFLNFSSIVIDSGIGNAAMAGTLLTMGTIAGMVVGVFYNRIFALTGKFTMALASATGFVAALLAYTGQSMVMLLLASVFTGICMTLLVVTTTINVGMVCSPEVSAKGTGIAMAFMSIGSFAATFYTSAFSSISGQDPLRFVFLISTIGFAVLMVLQIIFGLKKKSVQVN